MRICQVITRLIIGGAQENTLLTCEGLHDRGHEVLLLAGPDTGAEGSLWDRATQYGYRVQTIPSMHRAIRPLSDLRALSELTAAYSRSKPQIIHTHSSKAGILGRLAASHVGFAKVIHTIHGMSFNRTQRLPLQALYRELEYVTAARTDAFVTVAESMTEQAVLEGVAPRKDIITIPSGMNTEWFTPDPLQRATTRRELRVGDDEIVVGTVARLFRGKGYEQLIPTSAKAARINAQLRFVWIGDGFERDGYVRELSRLGIRDRVTLLGLIPPERVSDVMQGFDLMVHCSQWEGLPRAVVQALLLEIPVAGFDVDGTGEVVQDGHTGRLVPLNDLQALSEAILEIAANPNLRHRLGQNGRRHCLTRFDHRLMVDQLEQLYARLWREYLDQRLEILP